MDSRKKTFAWRAILIVATLIQSFYSISSYAADESLRFGRFGAVHIYRKTTQPEHVVLFVSGDGGWNQGVIEMAKDLTTMNTLVVGIDIVHYLRELKLSNERCYYPAAEFEALSKFLQKSLDFPHYIPPVLVGYSSGATLVYASLVQAPPNTFAGGISLGFCPDFALAKHFCKGYGLQSKPLSGKGYMFLPATDLQTPWIALQGETDRVCREPATEKYVKEVKNGQIIPLPEVGHGFAVPRNWIPQLRQALAQLTEHATSVEKKEKSLRPVEVKDLPLVEVAAKDPETDALAVIITGDGGWASIDRDIGNALAESGIPVVGFNSLQYFWSRRTPDEAAKDVQRILQHYLVLWKKQKAILIGYSFGADVLPFIFTRVSQQISGRVALVALLGPGRSADFEFHLTDWLGTVSHKNERAVLPEVQKMKVHKILCLYGDEETDSICKDLKGSQFVSMELKGGHHFGGAFRTLAVEILKQAD